MPFDTAAAKRAGYTDAEIAAYLKANTPRIPEPAPFGSDRWALENEYGIGAGGQFIARGLGQALQRAGSRLGLPISEPQQSPDPVIRDLEQAGTDIPQMLPIPGGFLANVAGGAGIGYLTQPSAMEGAIRGGLASGLGYAGGQLLGRVVNGINQAYKAVGARMTLPSGIQQTLGEAMNDPNLMRAEQGLARNAVTGTPFARIAEHNKALVAEGINSAIGQEGSQLTEATLGETYQAAVSKIHEGVPDNALITIPTEATNLVKRFNALPDEIVSIPEASVLTGKEFRNARSDILKLTMSSKATVREAAVNTIEQLDKAAMESGTVNPEIYREGRALYRLWKTLTSSGVTKPGVVSGTLDVNLGALDRSLTRSFGAEATQGGLTTGKPEVDALIQTVRDARRVRDFTGGSITSTGISPWLALRNPKGTAAAWALSEASQTPAALGAIQGAMAPQQEAGQVGGALLRKLATKKERQK